MNHLRVKLIASVACLAVCGTAGAKSHSWRFSEFYSSPDLTIQFIEMQEINGGDDEINIEEHWFATDSYNQDHSELLGSKLPTGTAHKQFLVGTESYAALPGVPIPDYVLPDGILDPTGDRVFWWLYQTLNIPPNTMPSDGVNSLNVIDPAVPNDGFYVAVNSPTNLAGDTGTVTLPELPAALASTVALAILGALVRTRPRVPSWDFQGPAC